MKTVVSAERPLSGQKSVARKIQGSGRIFISYDLGSYPHRRPRLPLRRRPALNLRVAHEARINHSLVVFPDDACDYAEDCSAKQTNQQQNEFPKKSNQQQQINIKYYSTKNLSKPDK